MTKPNKCTGVALFIRLTKVKKAAFAGVVAYVIGAIPIMTKREVISVFVDVKMIKKIMRKNKNNY